MPALILPWQSTAQPPGEFLPAEGWEFAWTPNFNPSLAAAISSSLTRRGSPLGGVGLYSGEGLGGQQISLSQDPLWNFGTGPFTIVTVFHVRDVVAANSERYLLSSSTLTNHWGLYLRSNGSAYTVRASQGLTSSTNYNLAPGHTAIVVTGRDRDGAAFLHLRNLNTREIEKRTGTNTGSWYLRVAGNPMRVLSHASGGFPGGVMMVGMRRDAIVPAEALLANPWQVFRAPRRVIARPKAELIVPLGLGAALARGRAASVVPVTRIDASVGMAHVRGVKGELVAWQLLPLAPGAAIASGRAADLAAESVIQLQSGGATASGITAALEERIRLAPWAGVARGVLADLSVGSDIDLAHGTASAVGVLADASSWLHLDLLDGPAFARGSESSIAETLALSPSAGRAAGFVADVEAVIFAVPLRAVVTVSYDSIQVSPRAGLIAASVRVTRIVATPS